MIAGRVIKTAPRTNMGYFILSNVNTIFSPHIAICPEGIHITDNAIIPEKERVVNEFYDPIGILIHRRRKKK